MGFLASLSSLLHRSRTALTSEVRFPIVADTSNGLLVPPELKRFLDCSDEEDARQREVLKARAFHKGDHGVKLTERLREFLQDDINLNFTRVVTMAVAERLKLKGLLSEDENEAARARQELWAKALFDDFRMDSKQLEIWLRSLTDGEFFLFAEWDADGNDGDGEIEIIPHPRYTSPQVSEDGHAGDGFGFRFYYPGGNTLRRPECAVKRSIETVGNREVEKLTIYWPNRIEPWERTTLGWQRVPEMMRFEAEEGDEALDGEWREVWPVPWVNEKGKPLGLPVVQLKTAELRPEALEAIRNQKPLNKTYLDFLVAGDETAFKRWLCIGADPVDEDGEPLATAPGQWIAFPDQKPDEMEVQALDAAALDGQIASLDKVIALIAMVTDTPVERFQQSAQIARKETLEQQNEPLLLKVEQRQSSFGEAFEDLGAICRRMQNHFGGGFQGVPLEEKSRFKADWRDARTKTIADRAAETTARIEAGFSQEEVRSDVWGSTN